MTEAHHRLIITENRFVPILQEHNILSVIYAAALSDIGNSGHDDTPCDCHNSAQVLQANLLKWKIGFSPLMRSTFSFFSSLPLKRC